MWELYPESPSCSFCVQTFILGFCKPFSNITFGYRQSQEVELDKHIHLLDSPGVILANKNELDNVEYALKNAIRIDNLSDPITPVQAILRRCSKDMVIFYF